MAAIRKYLLGTAIKITDLVNVNTLTSAKITIEDSSGTKLIDDANMSKEADKVYAYIFQSTTGNLEGVYVATLKATYAGYTGVSQVYFEMISPTNSLYS